MVTYSIIGVLVLVVALFIFFKNKNKNDSVEEKHKDKNAIKKDVSTPKVDKTKSNYVVQPRKVPSAKELKDADAKKAELEKRKLEKEKREQQRLEKLKLKEKKLQEKKAQREKNLAKQNEELKAKPQQEEKLEAKITKPVVEPKEDSKVEVEQESTTKQSVELPKCDYPKFDYSRLIQMGLGEDEAIDFIKELIPQIKTQIPLIKEALDASDIHNVERLTHSIKGSSTTVGTGGVADLLVEFNTYVKTEKNIEIIEAYLEKLDYYCKELEKEYA
jgi:HPt (histidine-containing phosphotransfer) domain-containing protein